MNNDLSDLLLEMIEVAPEHDQSIRLQYSGRGMYGITCIGISGNNPMAFFIDCAKELLERSSDPAETALEYFDLLSEHRTDSMGRGTILYFPKWSCDDELERFEGLQKSMEGDDDN